PSAGAEPGERQNHFRCRRRSEGTRGEPGVERQERRDHRQRALSCGAQPAPDAGGTSARRDLSLERSERKPRSGSSVGARQQQSVSLYLLRAETMLNLPGRRGCNCEGPTRRELLRIGSIGMMGLSLPHFFFWRDAHAAAVRTWRPPLGGPASKYAGAR